jgi:uncharacterized protein (DUF952 family)
LRRGDTGPETIMTSASIYKVVTRSEWEQARARGRYDGSADDHRDGFIHLSTREQLAGTLERHFRGLHELVLLRVDPDRVATTLKWEPARSGSLFPHIYGPLSLEAVVSVTPIDTGTDGQHIIPQDLP